MPLVFGRTLVPNFSRIFRQIPSRQLTRHPYLNFLRDYKRLHPSQTLVELMQRMETFERISETELYPTGWNFGFLVCSITISLFLQRLICFASMKP